MRCSSATALSDQGEATTYTLHGAYYLKDRGSRSAVATIPVSAAALGSSEDGGPAETGTVEDGEAAGGSAVAAEEGEAAETGMVEPAVAAEEEEGEAARGVAVAAAS